MEPFIRNQSNKSKDKLTFQILSWEASDEIIENYDSDIEQ